MGEYPSRAAPPLEPLSASEMETLSGLDLGTGGSWVLRDKYRPQQRQEQRRDNGEPPGLFRRLRRCSPRAPVPGFFALLLAAALGGGRLTMDVVAVFERPTAPWGFPVCSPSDRRRPALERAPQQARPRHAILIPNSIHVTCIEETKQGQKERKKESGGRARERGVSEERALAVIRAVVPFCF